MAPMPSPPFDVYDAHPLEMIGWFRRHPPGVVRDLVYTFVWNSLIAIAFTIVGALWATRVSLAQLLWWNFVFAQCIGYVIHILFAVTVPLHGRLRAAPRPWRVAYFACVSIVGAIAGYALAATLLGWLRFRSVVLSPRGLIALAVMALLMCGLAAALAVPRARAARAEAEVAREQARAAAAEREATFAHMKALEAQLEPHFLYNTLAHVASLIDVDPPAARAMLDRLIALLRDTSRAGARASTLGGQADLVAEWLSILGMRMGRRLAWSVDVPGELRELPVPPALLQPLVENAVKHGLEPALDGGRVDVAARRDGHALVIDVADTGRGFASAGPPLGGSAGTGLASLRARLAALHGTAASVVVAERSQGGVRVTLRLPLPGSPGAVAGGAA